MRDVRESRNPQASTRFSRVDQFSLTSFREAQHLDQAAATNVALDLSCVNDIDARGLGVLAGLVRRRAWIEHCRARGMSALELPAVVRLAEAARGHSAERTREAAPATKIDRSMPVAPTPRLAR